MLDLLLEGVRLSSGILRTTDNEPGSRFGSFRVLSSTRFVVFFTKARVIDDSRAALGLCSSFRGS